MDLKAQKRKFTFGDGLKNVDTTGEFIKKVHYLPPSCVDPSIEGSNIQEFFSGAHVLITGGTGFMGKTMVEKLLAACPKLSKIYLVIREKKGQTMEQRFNQLFSEAIFVRVQETVPNFRQKVVGINGDCSKLALGLSLDDYESLTKVVNVIIHGAATVNFEEKLRTATNINVRAVKEMVRFASKCPNLKSMVYISTIFCNTTSKNSFVEEKFYPPPMDYNELIDVVDSNTDEELEKMKWDLFKHWANSYVFTKAVAEDIVKKNWQNLPISMFRPSMVSPTYQEPIRGWSDNLYGNIGISVGAYTGILRVLPAHYDHAINIVPVDTAANAILAVLYETFQSFRKKKEVPIYNYASTVRNPVTWGEVMHWDSKYAAHWPTMKASWYPTVVGVSNLTIAWILTFLLHTLPAYVADAFLFLTGQDTMFRRKARNVNKFLSVLASYFLGHWRYTDSNMHTLWISISEKDKALFPFDLADVNWDYYSQAFLLGLRTYQLNDPVKTIPAAKRKHQRLMIQHMLVVLFCISATLWITYQQQTFLWT